MTDEQVSYIFLLEEKKTYCYIRLYPNFPYGSEFLGLVFLQPIEKGKTGSLELHIPKRHLEICTCWVIYDSREYPDDIKHRDV